MSAGEVKVDAPPELAWAWWGIIIVGVLVTLGERRAAKRLREATTGQLLAEEERRLAEVRVGHLNFELDGPLEDEPGELLERTAPADPESRSPEA